MRISWLLVAVASMAMVTGVFGGVGHLVQGAEYTVAPHAITAKDSNMGTVLSNSKGMTLYYFSADTSTKSNCTGDCAKIWLPLINEAPTKDPKLLFGTVKAVHTVHGAQVTFNGHLLYTYTGDAAPGEATGNGRGGKWFAATPALGKF